jgi:hypothetical protein
MNIVTQKFRIIMSIIIERRRFRGNNMNDESIFKLLLIILLMSNNYQNGDCHAKSLFGNLNDVIIMALMLGAANDGVQPLSDANTTFTQ